MGNAQQVSAELFRSTMARWPSGVAVLTVVGEAAVKSALVTSLSSASLDPPLIQISLSCRSGTHAALATQMGARVVVSMLAEDAEPADAAVVGSVESAAVTGQLQPHQAVQAALECDLYDMLPAGDHTIFLLRVCEASGRHGAQPTVYHDRAFRTLERSTPRLAAAPHHLPVKMGSHMESSIERRNYDTSVEADIRDWFRVRGANVTTRNEADRRHPDDFAEFVASSQLLSRTLVPTDDPLRQGWSPTRAAGTSAALASHSFTEWLMWHVSSLAALPVWMSPNQDSKDTYRSGFERGVFGAFGMSERAAGADWRHTQSVISRDGDRYIAHGQKDYAGNAQSSELVTTFARLVDGDGSSYAFFRADSRRQGYIVERNVVPEQMYVAQFRLDGYSFGSDDLITSGDQAFADAVNTLNVGKFNLATASVAMGRRALAETFQHTSSRALFGSRVSDFGQIRRGLNDAAIRLVALQAFNEATVESLERASDGDNSHRFMTSVAKSLVTQQAVHVVRDLGDVISAKAFETESMFRIMAQYVEWLPRLEGTRYVNMMQSIRAAQAFYAHLREPAVSPGTAGGPSGVPYLLSQRPLGGLEHTSFTHIDLSLLPADHGDVDKFLQLVTAMSELFVERPPRSADNEAAIEALAEVFTRSYFGIVVLQRLEGGSQEEEVVQRVARYLTDDLIACALRSRRAVAFPAAALAVMGSLTQAPTSPESGALLDVVGTFSDEFVA